MRLRPRVDRSTKGVVYCKCGCGRIIQHIDLHRTQGTPEYIHGHNRKGMDKSTKGVTYCACGCGKEIKFRIGHRSKGTPRYIKGHNLKLVAKDRKGKPGRIWTDDERKKISNTNKLNRESAWNWKGGVVPLNKQIRKGLDYKLWREAVFKRDNWTCQRCKVRGTTLHPHHIYSFAEYPKLRFEMNNGVTLCVICHKQFHQTFGKSLNTRSQLDAFLQK